jgi:hypothetical protein
MLSYNFIYNLASREGAILRFLHPPVRGSRPQAGDEAQVVNLHGCPLQRHFHSKAPLPKISLRQDFTGSFQTQL